VAGAVVAGSAHPVALPRPASGRRDGRQALTEFLFVLAVLAVVVVVVGWPLRAERRQAGAQAGATEPELADLEAAREAKYREIRDAELDHQTGKLSDDDFAALDASLRAEAIEILHAIDRYHREPR
jgi:hypothetical protein